MDDEFEMNENFDSEMEMYKLLAKIKNAGLSSDLSLFFERVLYLYETRFDFDNHLTEAKVADIANELIDCVNHVKMVDKNFDKLFDVVDTEREQLFLCGMILSIIRPLEIEE